MAIDEIEVDRDKKYINDLTELMIFDDDVLCYSTSCISDEFSWSPVLETFHCPTAKENGMHFKLKGDRVTQREQTERERERERECERAVREELISISLYCR